ncbi:MAG: MOSC domain-containing protein, partial [Pseudomonadota bacterium]
MSSVAALWRHPIKSHGRETLDHVSLTAGRTMPWDRRWAVAHELSKADSTAWSPCAAFNRGSKVASLMAIDAVADEAANTVTLRHPQRPDLCINPDQDEQEFLDWVRPLMPENRAQSTRLVRVPDRGMTDTDYPSVSLLNLASNAEVSDALGQDLSIRRWRGNIVMDDVPAWTEFDWIGRKLRIGTTELEVRERIERCMATTANPDTGERDADTLGTLNKTFGHQDFGIYAIVTKSGSISIGD